VRMVIPYARFYLLTKTKGIMRHIQLPEFTFVFAGHGLYKVLYTDPRGTVWIAYVNDMTIIDATKNADEPKQKDLHQLLRICRRG